MAAGHFAEAFRTLFIWSLEAFKLPPLLLFLLAALFHLAAAIAVQKPFRNGKWGIWCWLTLGQLAYFPLIVAVGVLFPAERVHQIASHSAVGEWALDLLGILSLVTGALWVYRMKGFRWFAFGLVFLTEVILMGPSFIAGMSVSGDWL